MLRIQDSVDLVASPPLLMETNGAVVPSEAAVAAFAHGLAIALRNHPHLNNVMTHIGLGRWDRIEGALVAIFSPQPDVTKLSPLARNLVELLWAEGGITGRIAKPFFLTLCQRLSSAAATDHFTRLLAGLEAELSRPQKTEPRPV